MSSIVKTILCKLQEGVSIWELWYDGADIGGGGNKTAPEKPGIPAGPKQEPVSVGLIEQRLLEAKLLLVNWLSLNALFRHIHPNSLVREWGIGRLASTVIQISLPLAAVGSVNVAKLRNITTIGIHGVALVAAICQTDFPRAAVQDLVRLIS